MIATLTRPPFGDDNYPIDDDAELVVSSSLELAAERSPVWPADQDRWDGTAFLSPSAEQCVIRFAAAEADVASPELVGLGRQSAVRFPRLGGVLHGRVAPESRAALMLTTGAARTIRAGYHAALATHQVAGEPVEHRSVDELWNAFVPASYRIPRSIAAIAWNVCRFDEFWEDLLLELDLDREAHRVGHGYASPLQRSIRGLSTVGVALAVTERGAQHERLAAGRRAVRAHRGALPPMPGQPPFAG